jgi:hypothetical protein
VTTSEEDRRLLVAIIIAYLARALLVIENLVFVSHQKEEIDTAPPQNY